MANIKVAVRVRPISSRESNLTGSEVVVHTESNEISLTNLKVSSSKAGDSRERIRKYGFDYCFDSSNPVAQNFADQTTIYQTLGRTVLDNVFTGYNSCLVAYGQSASGKTYTMMGTKEDPGLTPRLCEGLFARIEEERKNERNYGISVSYLEIYNERVRDLLKPSSSAGGLRVREHPRLGPYVQGLTHHVVRTLGSLMSCVEEGTRARKTASTLQNPSSSRSHALLTIVVAEGAGSEASSRRPSRGGSKLRLVDLAGSESAATCGGVHRLKEGANINKSLVALGNVISALAERGTSAGSGPARRFIPYRDSSLTWLLKDALGGNATTIMLATISPASGSYNETARTLRFAQRAQSVVNRPMVNEDPVAKIVRELRAEVARLKSLLLEKTTDPDTKVLCRCRRGIRAELIGTEGVGSCERAAERNSKEQEGEEGGIEWMARGGKKGAFPLQRSNSTDTVATYHQLVPCSTGRRFGSLELIESDRFAAGYNRARVTELNEEEEVSEIHESVFVDIPTLVAVLIKPDNNPDESSVHIEEIYSDEVVDESSNDVEFIEGDRSYERREIYEVNGRKTGQEVDKAGRERKRKFRKQDSVDAIPALTNLHASRKFGSVEAIQRRDPAFSFERSHTSLEKPLRPASSTIPDRVAKKLNDIREVEDRRRKNSSGAGKRASNERLERKGSNDSDRGVRMEVCGGAASQSNGCRARSFARKPSLENVRRKSSKDSSSSSSKDEQISTGRGDKPSSSRKNSLEQESSSILRNHTPIQRVKRAEIVAAVTERLYSSKRSAEDSPGMRSPTGEATADGATKSVARLKLQEISRKMLGKRRRVSVDTQTDCSRTVRMRDTASLTETSPIARRDVAISTDHRQVCEKPVWDKGFGPVLRVKEMATSTDKPSTVVSVVRCRDVGSSATDLEDYDCGLHSPRNDSGILSDDGQNYYAGSSSNPSSVEVSDFCQEGERGRVACTESSTNTSAFSTCRSFAVQTSRRTDQPTQFACSRRCCVQQQQSGERSVISISLPDSVSITIESRGSRISTREKDCGASKDESAQTKARRDEEETSPPLSRSRDNRTASTPSQTDCKVFRIENIFHDPNNAVERSYSSRADSKGSPRGAGAEERARIRNSITLRNSLGTSHASQGEEMGGREGLIGDGSITEAFINRKRSFTSRRAHGFLVHQDPSKNVSVEGAQPSFWRLGIGEIPFNVEANRDVACFRPPRSNDTNHDHGFSDDSLDYNESNASSDDPTTSLLTKVKQGMGRERENFCPPDVVAHTKKNCPKSIETDPKNEPVADFKHDRGEFLTRNPGKLAEIDAHGPESLTIFGGKPFRSYEGEMDESDNVSPNNSGRKKKVSFSSSTTVSEKRFDSIGILKPIIKRRRRRNAAADESPNPVHSSNEETEDSQQEVRGGLISKGSWREKTRSGSSEEGKEELAFEEEESSRKKNRRRVKFFAFDESSENTCSESESYENVEEEEEEEEEEEGINVLEEYLSEAVTLMRNLNSGTSTCRASLAHRGRSGTPPPWDLHDRSKFTIDRRGEDLMNPARIGDFSIDASTEISYERCVKGIQRLEDCIRRIDRHNELLKEKYGVDCESAGSRPDLANPSTDPHRASNHDDDDDDSKVLSGTREVGSRSSSSVAGRKDDLERKIFDQLMNVANSIRYRRSNVGPETPQSPTNAAKFRETEEPRRGEVRKLGNLSLEESWNDSGRQDAFATYEITGNLSVGRTCRFTERNSDTDRNSLDEDSLPPRRAFDRTIFDDEQDELSSTSSYAFPTKREARTRGGNWGRGARGNSPVQGWKRFEGTDDCSRWGIRWDVGQGWCRGCTCGSRDRSDIEAGVETRDKLRYPASPRARFLELLRERRRIVECCRGASAS